MINILHHIKPYDETYDISYVITYDITYYNILEHIKTY